MTTKIKMDKNFTKKIEAWLSTPEEKRSLQAGAVLLLQLDRNRWLYQQILRRRLYSKLEYELRKHLGIRRHGLTVSGTARFETEVMEKVSVSLPASEHHGLRGDHESLPDDIRSIPDENSRLFHQIKSLFESLKQREKEEPCDRHENVYQMCQLDEQLRQNWERYDNYAVSAPSSPSPEVPTASQVSAARKYLSTNVKKLEGCVESGDANGADSLREKMRERISIVLTGGGNFSPDFKARLESLGLEF